MTMYNGILLYLLALQNVGALASDDTISCIEKGIVTVAKSDGKGRCSAEVSDYPWTFGKTRTAPAPSNLHVGYIVEKKPGTNPSRHIKLVITWTQKDLFGVEGFHLELIHLEPPGSPRQYKMTLTNTTGIVVPAKFSFHCCGAPDSYPVGPKDEYVIKLQAMPIYQEDHIPQALRTNITIPDCSDKKIKRTTKCRDRRKRPPSRGHKSKSRRNRPRPSMTVTPSLTVGHNTTRTHTTTQKVMSTKQGFWNVANCTLVVVCGIVAVIMAVVLFFLCRSKQIFTGRRWRKDNGTISSNILLISTMDNRFVDVMNSFISIFHKFKHIELVSNLRSKVEVGERGILEWAKDKIIEADHVMFLPAFGHEHVLGEQEGGKKEYEQIAISVSVAKNVILTQKIQNPQNKFFAVDLNGCVGREHMIFCKRYTLAADLEKLLKCLLGRHSREVSDRDKTIFRNLLSNAQLNYFPKRILDGDVDDEEKQGFAPDEDQNNLDVSPHPSLTVDEQDEMKQPDSLNIVFEGYPSCDTNPAESYVTTDFNNDALDKFIRAGARPKGDC